MLFPHFCATLLSAKINQAGGIQTKKDRHLEEYRKIIIRELSKKGKAYTDFQKAIQKRILKKTGKKVMPNEYEVKVLISELEESGIAIFDGFEDHGCFSLGVYVRGPKWQSPSRLKI